MVNSVSQTPQVITPPIAKPTKTSIFYLSDEHAHLQGMAKLKSAYDEFDKFVPTKDVDKLVLLSGDISVGSEPKLGKLAVAFQNAIGSMASAVGNHELDALEKDLVENLKDAKYKTLAFNTNIDPSKELSKSITKAYIQEQNGTKYGIIGLLPFDLKYHLKDPQRYDYLNVMDMEKTVPELQKQIDDFKKQGVNKIILLSHAGCEANVELAKKVEGLDVILGGHTHKVWEDIKEGKNLFYSQKTGEPTIITEAGKNGRYFGILNLEFDENGVIIKAKTMLTKLMIIQRAWLWII